MDYTLTTLIANIRRRGSIPNTATTGNQDSDIIALVNDVLQLKLAAKLISVREGYFRQTSDITIGTSTRFRIPTRALGNKLAACVLVDSAGNVLRRLTEIPYGRLAEYNSVNDAAGYTFEAGSIVLKPGLPSGATSVRMVYYIRPNKVVSSGTFTVTAVNSSTGVVTIGSHSFTTSSKLDVIKANSPFEHVGISVSPTATTATTITLSDVTRIEVGDFVATQDESPVAQLPGEFYPLLAHLTAMELLQALGDRDNHERLAQMLPALEKEAVTLISPRNEEGPKKIMSSYGSLGAVGRRTRFGGV